MIRNNQYIFQFILHHKLLKLYKNIMYKRDEKTYNSNKFIDENNNDNTLIIIGGGIGGLALACTLLEMQNSNYNKFNKKIKIIICEKDLGMFDRAQGYSLTIQKNGFKVLNFLKIGDKIIKEGVPILKHVILNSDDVIIHNSNKYGNNKIKASNDKDYNYKRNYSIPRERLRILLYEYLLEREDVRILWGKSFKYYEIEKKDKIKVYFKDETKLEGNWLVGCDGTFSKIRNQLIGDELCYLGVIAINGISNSSINVNYSKNSSFQILDGSSRIFGKPFTDNENMWQLTFPTTTEEIKNYEGLKMDKVLDIALNKVSNWKVNYIIDLIKSTDFSKLRIGPLFDRKVENNIWKSSKVTLLGDSAHPMSPFKGQGANNALEDAFYLAEKFYAYESIEIGISKYEEHMRIRSSKYVVLSRQAVNYYHSPMALKKNTNLYDD